MMANEKADKPYILGRNLDLWVTGLLSICAVSLLLLVNPRYSLTSGFGDLLVLATVINGAHFMASYRMLYYSREHAMRYPQASVYMPLVLSAYCIAAVAVAETAPFMVSSLLIVTSLYLALHYTGQTWGMMSSLAFVDGIKFEPVQRKFFRMSLRLLIGWQVFWSLTILDPRPQWLSSLLISLDFLPAVLMTTALACGLRACFPMLSRRNLSELRVLVPYAALYCWYALLSVNKFALPLIQFFHAIQYLIFPLRVEINRHTLTGQDELRSARRHILEFILVMLALGAGAFVLIPKYLESVDPLYAAAVKAFIAAINIHHFYIDGYIWKISQPVVKEELFAHLKN